MRRVSVGSYIRDYHEIGVFIIELGDKMAWLSDGNCEKKEF